MQEALLTFEREFAQSVAGNDVAAIGRFVADDWVIVDADGRIIDRSRFLNVIESGALSHESRRSPWQNPFVESFGSRVRDEVLSVEAFDSVLEAQTVITDWRTIYNHRRPYSGLGWRPPAAYAASLTTNKLEKPARLS